ncbi:MAG TPA: hypothetical protein PLN55_11530 [Burkholderiaceae bacterium]|nr:hypothetical protein [Burkholderiaceae bacterium]
MIAHTGWTWDYVEEHMDLHRYAALQRQWRRFPPLQRMVQAYLGIEPEDEPNEPSESMTADEEQAAIERFMADFTAAGGKVH